MIAWDRCRWSRCAALALLTLLSRTGNAVLAAEPRSAVDSPQCRALVHNFLQRAPVMRRTDELIARLLDAKRYGQAQSQLRDAVSRYADPWAGYTLGNLYARDSAYRTARREPSGGISGRLKEAVSSRSDGSQMPISTARALNGTPPRPLTGFASALHRQRRVDLHQRRRAFRLDDVRRGVCNGPASPGRSTRRGWTKSTMTR